MARVKCLQAVHGVSFSYGNVMLRGVNFLPIQSREYFYKYSVSYSGEIEREEREMLVPRAKRQSDASTCSHTT